MGNSASVLDCLLYGRWGKSGFHVDSFDKFIKQINTGEHKGLGTLVKNVLISENRKDYHPDKSKVLKMKN